MSPTTETPRPLAVDDAAALIGLLAVLEGEVWAADDGSDTLPEWTRGLARRAARDGLVSPDAGNAELRRALGDLNQRLRYALGEHDEPDRRSS